MSIDVNWNDPYAGSQGEWLKGNLQTHTSPASKCGRVPAARVAELYVRQGYDFLSFSDHLSLTDPVPSPLIFIPGAEWNSASGEHTGIYACNGDVVCEALEKTEQSDLLSAMSSREALIILNHPNWQDRPHYRREELAERSGYDGIEIYNSVTERVRGCAIAAEKWDYLLASGRRVLGFGSDDSHLEGDIGLGWICVRSAERSADAVMSAMRRGSFYSSSGVVITDTGRDGDTLYVVSQDAQEIRAVSDGGRVVARFSSSSAEFDISGLDGTYIRFELYGQGSAMAWTQPFFS